MKKIYLLILVLLGGIYPSCNYLDIVPDEIPTESDAFSTMTNARKFLMSCYSFLPDPRDGIASMDFMTSDEVITAFEHETFANFPKGDYTPAQPRISYWNTLFAGIRYSYTLLDNIDNVPNMSADEKTVYKGEATFLIAYFHYLLLKNYGPILIIESTPDITMPVSEYPERRSYDECVEWIANKFDEAAKILPATRTDAEYGRATSLAAVSIKSRMYLYAASPLFNGGSSSFPDTDNVTGALKAIKNSEGKELFNTTYDPSKWVKAKEVAEEALEAAEKAGIVLYDIVKDIEEPEDPVQRTLRLVIGERTTKEFLWASTRKEGENGLQNKSTPFSTQACWNGVAPTLTMLEFFYTENGLPINEDPAYDYAGRYGYGPQTNGLGNTLNLNKKREPRFYSWVAFHNSNYEIVRNNKNKMLVQFRKNDNCGVQLRNNNYSPTGYLNKKGVYPTYSRESGNKQEGTWTNYPWPVMRLGELYLNYAEALIEIGGTANLEKAKIYIDKIRKRAGLKGVDETWNAIGVNPDQDKMRQIVRQERTIELYLENQRFWDVRRWLQGEKYFNVKARGMNIQGVTDAEFFRVTEVSFQRKFLVPAHYLMPIPQSDINNNSKIVQNPGY